LYGEPDIVEIGKIFENVDSAIKFEEVMIDELNAVKDLRWLNCQNAGKTFNNIKSKNKGYKFGVGKDNPRYGIQSAPSPESNEKRKKTMLSLYQTGKIQKVFGRKDSDETTKRRKDANSGESNGMFGKHHSEDAIRRMSEKKKGKYNGPSSNLFGQSKIKEECIYCHKICSKANVKRWHGDKCKERNL
jgi:hypothetical protein